MRTHVPLVPTRSASCTSSRRGRAESPGARKRRATAKDAEGRGRSVESKKRRRSARAVGERKKSGEREGELHCTSRVTSCQLPGVFSSSSFFVSTLSRPREVYPFF